MSDVFISYAHVNPDQEFAANIQNVLEARGFPVFVDTKIRLGDNWVEQIDTQLRKATHFIVLLSPASIQSDMVRREVAIAYKLRKARQLSILPIRLNLDVELPYELSAYLDLIQHVVWRPGQPFDPICSAVLEAVRGPVSSTGQFKNTAGAKRFDAPAIEAVKADLARHLGPVARIIVDRAVKKAGNWDQLYDILASEIPADEERRVFQANRRH